MVPPSPISMSSGCGPNTSRSIDMSRTALTIAPHVSSMIRTDWRFSHASPNARRVSEYGRICDGSDVSAARRSIAAAGVERSAGRAEPGWAPGRAGHLRRGDDDAARAAGLGDRLVLTKEEAAALEKYEEERQIKNDAPLKADREAPPVGG